MKPALVLAAVLLAASVVAGCASDDYGYGDGGNYYGYYDGYYGAFAGGYWGPGGTFYYYSPGQRRYFRDRHHHFRRDDAPGYHRFQGQSPRWRDHDRRHDWNQPS